MTVAIQIRHTHHPPAGRKSWAARAADEKVVVQIPERCLMGPGIVKHIIGFFIAVKVEFCSCWRSVWLDSNIINVFFAVKGCTVGHISSGIIGNHSDVIADLGLVWITDEGIKGSSYRHVCRPRST